MRWVSAAVAERQRHPELCFTARACSCLDADDWQLFGKVYKGFDVVQHISLQRTLRSGTPCAHKVYIPSLFAADRSILAECTCAGSDF